ncbi:MAG: amino acid permease [Acidobacteriota bacterium]|nr:amino acid permease [Acidobacteriota bacterium]
MGGFSNFAISFTIISILAGTLTLYGFGMNTGGPVDINIGWPVVGLMVLVVGLCMAEICSVYPTAGGLYFWSAKLAPEKSRAAWSWMVGWFDVMGEVGVTAGIDFGLALFTTAELDLLFGYSTSVPWHIIVIYAGILFIHGLLGMGQADYLYSERVPALELLRLHNIPYDYATVMRARWRPQAKNGTLVDITGARKPEWLAENLSNPPSGRIPG